MGFAAETVRDYFRRTGAAGDRDLDGCYSYQMAVLRDMLARLELILDDEGVPRETAQRVIRCMVYGAPSAADAEERMRREALAVEMLKRTTTPIHVSGIHPDALAKLGFPPR
jgi:hypothetical protein